MVVLIAILRRSAGDRAVREHFEKVVVQPLAEGRVLPRELHDFLSDDSSPERADGRDLRLCEVRHVLDELVIDAFDFEVLALDLHLLAEVLLDDGLKFCCVLAVEGCRDAVVLGVEGIKGVEHDVQLLGNSELLPTGDRHLAGVGRIGVAQTLLEVEEALLEGHLHLGGDSPCRVVAEAARVPDQEAVGRLHFNLEGEPVDLGHPPDFSEGHGVSVVESVLLLFVQTHQSALLLGDAGDVHSLPLLACGVEDAVRLSEVDEGVSVKSEVPRKDETVSLGVHGFV